MKLFWINTGKCRLCVKAESKEALAQELLAREIKADIEGESKPDDSMTLTPCSVAEIDVAFIVKPAPETP